MSDPAHPNYSDRRGPSGHSGHPGHPGHSGYAEHDTKSQKPASPTEEDLEYTREKALENRNKYCNAAPGRPGPIMYIALVEHPKVIVAVRIYILEEHHLPSREGVRKFIRGFAKDPMYRHCVIWNGEPAILAHSWHKGKGTPAQPCWHAIDVPYHVLGFDEGAWVVHVRAKLADTFQQVNGIDVNDTRYDYPFPNSGDPAFYSPEVECTLELGTHSEDHDLLIGLVDDWLMKIEYGTAHRQGNGMYARWEVKNGQVSLTFKLTCAFNKKVDKATIETTISDSAKSVLPPVLRLIWDRDELKQAYPEGTNT